MSSANAEPRVRTGKITVIGFHSPTCKYCKEDYKELGRMFVSGKYVIFIFDANQVPSLRKRYGVTRYPTYFAVQNGKVLLSTTDLGRVHRLSR